jgi:hypothetical protein
MFEQAAQHDPGPAAHDLDRPAAVRFGHERDVVGAGRLRHLLAGHVGLHLRLPQHPHVHEQDLGPGLPHPVAHVLELATLLVQGPHQDDDGIAGHQACSTPR